MGRERMMSWHKLGGLLMCALALTLSDPASAQTLLESAHAVTAETTASSQAETGPSTYDRIWKFAEWYQNETNPVLQSVLFSGRFQLDYAGISADQGSHREWNIRRLRLGARSKLYRTLTLHGEVELNPQEADPLYTRVTDLYLRWSRNARLQVTVGKHGAPFTVDGATSSKELVAIDRSNLSNNMWFPQEYFPGASVSGERSAWMYHAGVYSAGAANREFGEFNGSLFGLGVFGYDFAKALGVDEALVTGNYVYQGADPDNTFTRQLDHTVSVNLRLDTGQWGLRTDVSRGSGYLGQSDLWGLMAMPFVNLNEKLQLVGRYTFLESDRPNGVRLATYESRLVAGRGDRYRELYLGANYYFYGHKLKLQTGIQWGNMSDRARDGGAYSGVASTTGLRVSW